MFHVKPAQVWDRIASAAGHSLTETQINQLGAFRDWLSAEAIPAGGLAPGEAGRLDLRHIADSLLFLQGIDPALSPILDVGTGVGLPGIPLAIAMPDSQFLLLDRSGRRVDLARRAVRVLDLKNVQVKQGDFANWDIEVPTIVSRATIPPNRFSQLLAKALSQDGRAVLGGSWEKEPSYDGYETKEIGREILAQPVWILIMHAT